MKKITLPLFSIMFVALLSQPLFAQDTQAPPVPEEPTIVSTTQNSATVMWDNVASDGGMMGYLVYLDGAQEADTVYIGELVGYTDHYPKYREIGNSSDYRTLYFTAYELDPATTYSIELAAIDSALNLSAKSPAVDVTTEAASPEGKFTIYPTDDANIIGGSGNYLSFNMGDFPLLLLSTHPNFDGWHTASRPFIKFDISGITDVSSANLKMFGGLWNSAEWLDEQPIYTIKEAFYEVGSDWDEETILFSTVPDEDIGADLEDNPEKDALTNYDTLLQYTPVSYTTITNDPAKLGISAPADNNNIAFTWHTANFKPFIESKISEGSDILSFTMVDTTFDKYNYFRFFSKDSYANRLHLEIEGTLTDVNKLTLDNRMQVFPNPVNHNHSVVLSMYETDDYTVQLLDLTGKQMFETNLSNANMMRLNTQALSLKSGIYFLRIINSQGVSGVKKLIVK